MKPIYFPFRDLSIKNINYLYTKDHTNQDNWVIPVSQWNGNKALWNTARLVAPVKRAIERTYYVTQGDDLDEMRRQLLQEDVNLPPIGFG